MSDGNNDTRDKRKCRACGLRRPTTPECSEHRWSSPDDICWARAPRCMENYACIFCGAKADWSAPGDVPKFEHDDDCAWVLARTLTGGALDA